MLTNIEFISIDLDEVGRDTAACKDELAFEATSGAEMLCEMTCTRSASKLERMYSSTISAERYHGECGG